jgi:hypothetical protein
MTDFIPQVGNYNPDEKVLTWKGREKYFTSELIDDMGVDWTSKSLSHDPFVEYEGECLRFVDIDEFGYFNFRVYE